MELRRAPGCKYSHRCRSMICVGERRRCWWWTCSTSTPIATTAWAATAREHGLEAELEPYFTAVDAIVPSIKRLIDAARAAGVPVVYCRIASSVADCSDVSRQHRDLRIFAPPGSREAEILDELRPEPGEIVLSKTCGGVFNGTNIDTVLRNLGVDTLVVTGVVTNGCVENAVRDASDRGYRTILVDDACAALTPALHEAALLDLKDVYCNVRPAATIVQELAALAPAHGGV